MSSHCRLIRLRRKGNDGLLVRCTRKECFARQPAVQPGISDQLQVTIAVRTKSALTATVRFGRQALIHQEPTEYSSNLSHPPESSPQNLTEETFDRDCKATRLHVPSLAIMRGNNTDIERSMQTANGLIALDEEGQAECPGSLGDRLSDFRGVTDGIGSQTVIPALIVAWPLHG